MIVSSQPRLPAETGGALPSARSASSSAACSFGWRCGTSIPATSSARCARCEGKWLLAGVAVYLAAIGLRCLRWGILLRATGTVKWRHAAEALVTGFAANYVLPGRVGELFRADYARRVFNMSRFTALGTIVVERVCDGIVLVCALWIGFAWILFARSTAPEKAWVLLVGAAASMLFGAALIFILLSQRIDLRRFGVMESIATRWDRLIDGVASVLRGHATVVAACSIGVWILEVLALASVVRSFGVSLSPPECLMLLGLASLSTLVPTAPGYVGTYQLVFAHVFHMFGYQHSDRNHRRDRGADFLLRHGDDPGRHRAALAQRPDHLAGAQMGLSRKAMNWRMSETSAADSVHQGSRQAATPLRHRASSGKTSERTRSFGRRILFPLTLYIAGFLIFFRWQIFSDFDLVFGDARGYTPRRVPARAHLSLAICSFWIFVTARSSSIRPGRSVTATPSF